MSMLRLVAVVLALAAITGSATGQPRPRAEPGKNPWYIDDTKFLDTSVAKLAELAKAGKCLAPAAVAKKASKNLTCSIAPAKPADKPLTPEAVYQLALPSTYALGCVIKPEKPGDDYDIGWFATAWAVNADGVLVTNWHIFEKPDRAYFGAVNHKGEVFPLTDILAVNKKADVAVVKVAGTGFAALPVATESAEVGAWVGVLSHPGHQWFTYTQGHVTRYTRNFGDLPEARGERWMNVTAEFAGGSSGGPVLNRFGAVVGMACLTSNIDFDDEGPPPDEKPKPNPDGVVKPKPGEKPPPADSRVQMIVKLTVPAAQFRKVFADGR